MGFENFVSIYGNRIKNKIIEKYETILGVNKK